MRCGVAAAAAAAAAASGVLAVVLCVQAGMQVRTRKCVRMCAFLSADGRACWTLHAQRACVVRVVCAVRAMRAPAVARLATMPERNS